MAPTPTKPDHSAHGEILQPSNAKNSWTKDTKVKTAKCRLCGDKVDLWSWRCNRCSKRICSECCEHDSSGTDFNKQSAHEQLEKGCWCTRFMNDFNPKFANLKSKLPPKQTEQLAKVSLPQPLLYS